MAPTFQTDNSMIKRDRNEDKRSDLICRVKYMNNLPDIPFDLKFLNYPFEGGRFRTYNPTSLESGYRHEVLTESDLGVFMDLVDPELYKSTQEGYIQLDPADEKLLEEDIIAPTDTKRSRHHARNVSWLRRTEYISTEQTRFQPQSMDKVEAKVGYSVKRKFNNQTFYMDRDTQVKSIEQTFEDSKKPIKNHYSKPNVTALEVLPIFPDFELWKYPCAQVIFDSDPAPVGKQFPIQLEEMSQAMIRGVKDESGEQFVAYFLPTEETIMKRRQDLVENIPYQEDEEYEYKMAREYNWNVKSKATKGYEENYFLTLRNEAVYYNELETRVRLTKRRQKLGQLQTTPRLLVKYRMETEDEVDMQKARERQLEPQVEEEEEFDERNN